MEVFIIEAFIKSPEVKKTFEESGKMRTPAPLNGPEPTPAQELAEQKNLSYS